jgi:nitrate/nitrite transporter NarK
MVAVFMSAIPLSGVIGGPVSGWILSRMAAVGGIHGWQWLFLLEGLPSVLAGALALAFLEDGPAAAKWLSAPEKQSLLAEIACEEQTKRTAQAPLHSFRDAFSSRLIWVLCLIFFGFASGSYGLGFWLPQLIADKFAATAGEVGLLSAIPWAAGTPAMLLVGRHSDRTGERRWHIAGSGLIGGISFAFASSPRIGAVASLAALSFAAAGIMVTISLFWSLPTAILSSTAAAAGIAWINSIGSLSGYVCPMLIGVLREKWGSMTPPLLALAATSVAASTAVLWVLPAARPRIQKWN